MLRSLVWLFLSLLATGGTVLLASQAQISSTERASQLLFYLASNDVTMGRDQIKDIMGRTDTADSGVYRRLYENEMDRILNDQRIKKEKAEEPEVFHFKSWDVRRAAMKEFLAIGDEAIPVLRRSIHSGRQDLVLGILKTLKELDAKDTLTILMDVLERDPEGKTRFSSRVRREAIIGLRHLDPMEGRWRKLLEDNVVDADAEVRSLACETVTQVIKLDAEWAIRQMERGLVHEMDLLAGYRAKAAKWDNLQAFQDDPARFSSVLRVLEMILTHAPQIYPHPLPEILKPSESILRLSLLHHAKLDPAVRKEIIFISLTREDSALELDALRALEDSDRESFATMVLGKLKLQTAPAVLSEAIKISGVWKLVEGRSSLESIAALDRRPAVKALAEETLKSL